MNTTIATAGGEPVTEFRLIPFGRVDVERAISGGPFTFMRRHADSAVRWFNRLGRRLVIDYEHQSMAGFNRRPDALAPAAGWIGRLEVRGDGLWCADVEWTARARELIASGEYSYYSPVIYWTDEDQSDVRSLGPVALTNDPAMRVPPLAASQERRGGMFVTICGIRPLPLVANAGAPQVESADARIYDVSPALHAEFGSRANYLAFRRAERAGLVNICGGGRRTAR